MIQSTNHLPNNHLTDNTKNHQCSQCGECCSDAIHMTDADIARIRRYIQKHNIHEEDHTKAYNLLAMAPGKVIDMTCPFLRIHQKTPQTTECLIYPVRPAICKAFTCEVASNSESMEKIYMNLTQILTPSEMMKLTSNSPKSMRMTFFPK